MAFTPKNRSNLKDFNEETGQTPLNGYDVLSFNGEEWEKIAKSFVRKDDLLKCLVWLKRSSFENGKLYIESKATVDYILAQGDWCDAIRYALPNARMVVGSYKCVKRMEKTKYRFTDKDGSDHAQNGLSVQINYLPVAKYFDDREPKEEKSNSSMEWAA